MLTTQEEIRGMDPRQYTPVRVIIHELVKIPSARWNDKALCCLTDTLGLNDYRQQGRFTKLKASVRKICIFLNFFFIFDHFPYALPFSMLTLLLFFLHPMPI